MDEPTDRMNRALDIAAVVGLERDTLKTILDIGTGSGGIAHGFGTFFSRADIVSIDVADHRSIKGSYRFELYDGKRLPFADNHFDLVVFNHVLEHVGNRDAQLSILAEIRRVLDTEGVLYLGVPNKWAAIETHLRIPFLSWLPKGAADSLVKKLRKGEYFDVDSPSISQLRRMLNESGFDCSRRESQLLRARSRRSSGITKFRLAAQSALLRVPLPFVPTIITRCNPTETKSCFFGTRKFPPSVGGMESHSKNVYEIVGKAYDVELVASGRKSPKHLVWFLPYFALRALKARLRGERFFLLGDPLMLAAIKLFLPPEASVTLFVHGLDMTFPNPVYQRVLKWSLGRADKVVANSEATARVAQRLGIDRSKIVIAPPAVSSVTYATARQGRAALEAEYSISPDQVVCFTMGRLVKRKGVAWFVEHVFASLPNNFVYLIAGEGSERPIIERAIYDAGIGDRIKLLGRVSEKNRILLAQEADIFVMPNIPVEGDMEGFGLVAAEAALGGTIVVASSIEGIKDAVIANETGVLLEPANAELWVAELTKLAETDLRSLGLEVRDNAYPYFGPEAIEVRILGVCGDEVGPSM